MNVHVGNLAVSLNYTSCYKMSLRFIYLTDVCTYNIATNGEQGGNVGATPTVGQGSNAKGGVGKKKATGRPGVAQPGAAVTEEKDLDGSFRIPGYRGVWVNKSGKHFVKIEGKRLTDNRKEDGKLLLFDNIDDAARMHDKIVNKGNQNEKVELNFKSSGSRIIYEDITPASTSGLGGSAANVVPALSVINIKVSIKDKRALYILYFNLHFSTFFLFRICHQMSSLCCVTLGRPHEPEGIQNGMFMLIVVFVVKRGRGMIDGRVRFLSWELIII